MTGGIFGRSRNPVYLGLALLAAGVFLVLGRLVLLVLAIVFLVYFRSLIRREERFLAERYGNAYREYARAVGRWWTWRPRRCSRRGHEEVRYRIACRGPRMEDAMQFDTIEVTCDGPLGRLTLARPDRLNAMGATMLRELAEAARWFDRQPEVRVVVVSGAGRAFSAGADLQDRPIAAAAPESGNAWAVRREVGQYGLRMADAIEQMRPITIAQVHGYAVGGGLVLMAACDLRVAAEDTVFSIPEIELGIPLAWGGIPRLVREIGPALTKELVITCRRFTAAEAKAAGLINRVVPAARSTPRWRRWRAR